MLLNVTSLAIMINIDHEFGPYVHLHASLTCCKDLDCSIVVQVQYLGQCTAVEMTYHACELVEISHAGGLSPHRGECLRRFDNTMNPISCLPSCTTAQACTLHCHCNSIHMHHTWLYRLASALRLGRASLVKGRHLYQCDSALRNQHRQRYRHLSGGDHHHCSTNQRWAAPLHAQQLPCKRAGLCMSAQLSEVRPCSQGVSI
jgi:hypothetical protein